MKELPYRQIHMDFHTSPHINEVGEKFNADEFVSTLKDARVNSINLFAKCHHGMYYYPTKIGTMHPGLKFDLLGEQIKACRDKGIRVCAYTTVVWNEDWADRHPEWMQIDMEGTLGCKKPFYGGYNGLPLNSWRSLCMNNSEHVKYIKAELKEIFEMYRPDGYWIDIIWQFNCVCSHCLKEMKQMGLDPTQIQDVRRHDRFVEIKFMKEIFTYINDMHPGAYIFFNGSPTEFDLADDVEYSTLTKRKYITCIDIESLPSDAWGYTHFPVLVNYANTTGKEVIAMNGKFHKAWGDFGSLRNLAALEYECFRALANGAKCCTGDQLHPSGKIEPSVYKRIGEVFSRVEKKEKWCYNTKKVSQIGVYAANHVLEKDQQTSNEGVYRMLSEMHHLFDFIDFESKIDTYDLLILPDNVMLSHEAAEKLAKYIENGGKLILTSRSGLNEHCTKFVLEEFGVEYISEAEYNPRYAHITGDRFPGIPPMDYVLYECGLDVMQMPGSEVLAYITEPYFNRTYDRFCSHRQTPPFEVTAKPFIVKNRNVIYIASPLFRDYAINGCLVYKDIIGQCIDMLLDSRIILTDLPSTADASLRKQGDNFILHVLHYIPQRKCRNLDIIEEVIPLYNKNFRILTDRSVKRVCLVPQETELHFSCDGKYVEFTIPEVNGHEMVLIEV